MRALSLSLSHAPRLALLLACAGCGSSSASAAGGTHYQRDSGALGADAAAGADGSSEVDAAGESSSDSSSGGPGDAASEGSTPPLDAGSEAAVPLRLVVYASGYGPDIQWLSLDATTGALATVGSVTSFGTAPSFLAVDSAAKHLYAVDENTPGKVGAYTLDPKVGALSFQGSVASGGDGPPFVTVDPTGRWVFVANYDSGTVAVLPIQVDGSLGAAVATATPGTNAHMMVADPSGKFVFVPCLGSDYVAQYLFDATAGKLTPNAVPHLATAAGAGPRHLAFHPDGKLAYLIDETASTMTALSLDTTAGTLSVLQTVSTRASGASGTNTAAEVHVHPSGKWLFGSNRGDDDIAVFALDGAGKMTAQGFTKTGGTTPRDFTLDPTGSFLYAANQGSGTVVSFRFDAAAGTLGAVGGAAISVPAASFVGVVALP